MVIPLLLSSIGVFSGVDLTLMVITEAVLVSSVAYGLVFGLVVISNAISCSIVGPGGWFGVQQWFPIWFQN